MTQVDGTDVLRHWIIRPSYGGVEIVREKWQAEVCGARPGWSVSGPFVSEPDQPGGAVDPSEHRLSTPPWPQTVWIGNDGRRWVSETEALREVERLRAEVTALQQLREAVSGSWTIWVCPDCGATGKHLDTCTCCPGEPVEHGNRVEVVPVDHQAGAVSTEWPKTLYLHGFGRGSEWSTRTHGDWKKSAAVEVVPVNPTRGAVEDLSERGPTVYVCEICGAKRVERDNGQGCSHRPEFFGEYIGARATIGRGAVSAATTPRGAVARDRLQAENERLRQLLDESLQLDARAGSEVCSLREALKITETQR